MRREGVGPIHLAPRPSHESPTPYDPRFRLPLFSPRLTYTTDLLKLESSVRYTLRIGYAGDRYESTYRLQSVVPIDSLYFDGRKGFLGLKDGMRATISFRDPEGTKSFYLWDQFVNGVRIVSPDRSFKLRVVASDEVIDGQEVTGFQPYDGVVVLPGDRVQMRQVALSEAAYRYDFALSEQTSIDGSPFSVTPSSVRGNVSNISAPSRVALGYFMVSEVSEQSATLRATR